LHRLFEIFLDGIPTDLCSKLLPWSSWLHLGTVLHVHLHAKFQIKLANRSEKSSEFSMSKKKMVQLIEHLENCVQGLNYRIEKNRGWSNYFNDQNYTPKGREHKRKIVETWIDEICPKSICDVGANRGEFSILTGIKRTSVVSIDSDHDVIECNYNDFASSRSDCLRLVVDIASPSCGVGWENTERPSFLDRFHFDLILFLGLVHHLTITQSIPLEKVARVISRMGNTAVIEFIPISDSNAKRLFDRKEGLMHNYSLEYFESIFSSHFDILRKCLIDDSERVLFLIRKKHVSPASF
jgi:2-polyprenyl-3-methyl-5-hydroxy-6-metoxy-1,4-benzoquinol methylase